MILELKGTQIKSTENIIHLSSITDSTIGLMYEITVEIPYDTDKPIFIPIDDDCDIKNIGLYNIIDGEYIKNESVMFYAIRNKQKTKLIGIVVNLQSGKYAISLGSVAQDIGFNLKSLYYGNTLKDLLSEYKQETIEKTIITDVLFAKIKNSNIGDLSSPIYDKLAYILDLNGMIRDVNITSDMNQMMFTQNHSIIYLEEGLSNKLIDVITHYSTDNSYLEKLTQISLIMPSSYELMYSTIEKQISTIITETDRMIRTTNKDSFIEILDKSSQYILKLLLITSKLKLIHNELMTDSTTIVNEKLSELLLNKDYIEHLFNQLTKLTYLDGSFNKYEIQINDLFKHLQLSNFTIDKQICEMGKYLSYLITINDGTKIINTYKEASYKTSDIYDICLLNEIKNSKVYNNTRELNMLDMLKHIGISTTNLNSATETPLSTPNTINMLYNILIKSEIFSNLYMKNIITLQSYHSMQYEIDSPISTSLLKILNNVTEWQTSYMNKYINTYSLTYDTCIIKNIKLARGIINIDVVNSMLDSVKNTKFMTDGNYSNDIIYFVKNCKVLFGKVYESEYTKESKLLNALENVTEYATNIPTRHMSNQVMVMELLLGKQTKI